MSNFYIYYFFLHEIRSINAAFILYNAQYIYKIFKTYFEFQIKIKLKSKLKLSIDNIPVKQ